MKLLHFCFILCTLFSYPVYCQTFAIERLLNQVRTAATDRQKFDAIEVLAEEYKSINRDSLARYAYEQQAIAEKLPDDRSKAVAKLTMARMYGRWGWTDSTLTSIQEGLEFVAESSIINKDVYFKLLREKAMALGGASRYREALDVLYALVSMAEKYKDTVTVGVNLTTIGSVSLARGKPREALSWLRKALAIATTDRRFNAVRAAIYINVAEAYNQLKLSDSAVLYINKGILQSEKDQNLSSLAVALQRQSDIFLKAEKFVESENALKRMAAVRLKMGDADLWIDDNLSLVNFYVKTGQVDKAITFCKDKLHQGKLLEKNDGRYGTLANNIKIRLKYYEALSDCYKIKGDARLYEESLVNIIAAKDSFYEANAAGAIAELQTRYDVQKKENTIIQQQFELLKKDYLFYGSLIFLLLIAVIGYIVFRNYRNRQQMRLEFMQQEEKKMAADAIRLAQETERKRISRDLHDNLGAYAASLGSNVDRLAQDISVTERTVSLKELRSNSEAIVAMLNDTIWVLRKDAYTQTAIGDRIKLFIQRLEKSYPERSVSFIEVISHEWLFSPSHTFHLFQIVGEGINNALRHSNADQILIKSNADEFGWEISIVDNGDGMPEKITGKQDGGNGLGNMRSRAEECGWQLIWLPNKPSGTIISLFTTY